MAGISERVKPYEGKENYIFVSYSHRDSERVFPLLRTLSDQGYRIWYDEGIDPGTEWPESIAAHLAGCKVCLAFISASSIQSTNCRREINFALSRNKDFLSVVLEEVEMSPGMEMQISTYQSLMSYKYPRREDFEEKLLSVEILRPCQAQIAKTAPEAVPIPAYRNEQPSPQPLPAQQVPSAVPVYTATAYQSIPEDSVPQISSSETAAQPAVAAKQKTEKQAEKKKIPLIWIILPAAAILTMLVVLLILNPFKKTVEINGKKYTNDSSSITIRDAAITAENMRVLSEFDKCTSMFFSGCTFESGAVKNFASMTQLNTLSFKDCEGVDDLSFLTSLSSLYTLVLNGCGLTDAQLPNLDTLQKLKTVDLGNNRLTKIPSLPAVLNLLMENNSVSDLSPLSGISTLRQLNLSGNILASLRGIEGSEKIEELYLGGNHIRDISELETFVYLKKIDLSGNDFQSTQPLSNCTILTEVNLRGCRSIQDLQFLENNTETLTYLDISSITGVDLSFLASCGKMKKLNIVSCSIEDLSFVSDMTELQVLNAADNSIGDLSPLAGCASLQIINLADNMVETLNGLPQAKVEEGKSNPSLSLLLHNNRLKNLNGLDPDYQYKILTVYNNPLEDGSAINGVKGYRLITQMCSAFDPASLTGFTKVYVPETVTEYRLDWEKALATRLSSAEIEEALAESLKYSNIENTVIFNVE